MKTKDEKIDEISRVAALLVYHGTRIQSVERSVRIYGTPTEDVPYLRDKVLARSD